MRILLFIPLIACAELEPDDQPLREAALWVLESDYTTGLISGWNDSFQAQVAHAAADGDARLVRLGERLGLLQRGHGDNLMLLDAALVVQDQWALAERSNPQDALRIGHELWVSLYRKPYLLRLDAQSGNELSRIDLSRFSDADERPEASDLLRSTSGLVYLVLQNLDFSGVEPIPPTQSQLLVFDHQAQLLRNIAIPSNPFGAMIELADGSLLMACNGGWGIDQRAGLWRFDPETDEGLFLVEEEQLDGNILSFSATADHVFLVIAKSDFSTELRRLSLSDGVLSEEFTGPSSQLGCVHTLSNGQTWVCDRSAGVFGIRRVENEDKRISDTLIMTRLAPIQILENAAL